MSLTAVPAAVFADAVLRWIADNVRFGLFRHLTGIGTFLRLGVSDVITAVMKLEIFENQTIETDKTNIAVVNEHLT